MDKKVVLITGTSTGLGFETSLLLAEKGYNVYATLRDLKKSQALVDAAKERNVSLNVKELDVTKSDSVNTCVKAIYEEEGRIDILINNAGAGFIRTTEQATEEEIEWQFNLNLMGTIRCTKAVLPIMREQRSGQVINISSVGGLVGQPFNEFYCAAKFGVEGYTESLAAYIQPAFNIRFTAIEPGGISTEFNTNVLGQFQQSGGMLDDEYKPILEGYIAGVQKRVVTDNYQTPNEVAKVVLSCVESDNPPVRMRTSEWGEEFSKLKTVGDPTGKIMQNTLAAFIK